MKIRPAILELFHAYGETMQKSMALVRVADAPTQTSETYHLTKATYLEG
jgi:hypothetical protein